MTARLPGASASQYAARSAASGSHSRRAAARPHAASSTSSAESGGVRAAAAAGATCAAGEAGGCATAFGDSVETSTAPSAAAAWSRARAGDDCSSALSACCSVPPAATAVAAAAAGVAAVRLPAAASGSGPPPVLDAALLLMQTASNARSVAFCCLSMSASSACAEMIGTAGNTFGDRPCLAGALAAAAVAAAGLLSGAITGDGGCGRGGVSVGGCFAVGMTRRAHGGVDMRGASPMQGPRAKVFHSGPGAPSERTCACVCCRGSFGSFGMCACPCMRCCCCRCGCCCCRLDGLTMRPALLPTGLLSEMTAAVALRLSGPLPAPSGIPVEGDGSGDGGALAAAAAAKGVAADMPPGGRRRARRTARPAAALERRQLGCSDAETQRPLRKVVVRCQLVSGCVPMGAVKRRCASCWSSCRRQTLGSVAWGAVERWARREWQRGGPNRGKRRRRQQSGCVCRTLRLSQRREKGRDTFNDALRVLTACNHAAGPRVCEQLRRALCAGLSARCLCHDSMARSEHMQRTVAARGRDILARSPANTPGQQHKHRRATPDVGHSAQWPYEQLLDALPLRQRSATLRRRSPYKQFRQQCLQLHRPFARVQSAMHVAATHACLATICSRHRQRVCVQHVQTAGWHGHGAAGRAAPVAAWL
eukprot:358180-Chlamydomonas_euryale.AAC.9